MSPLDNDNFVVLRRCKRRKQADQYALVLVAMGIRALVVREGEEFCLAVAASDELKADYELSEYDRENPAKGVRPAGPAQAVPGRWEAAMMFWALMFFFFAASERGTWGVDWFAAGAAQAGAMLDGQWWRAVTALCLHGGATHLFGNLVFGTAFSMLLSQSLGNGVAWLSMIVAGTVGNVANALIQAPTHTSVGASTALFAAIGILASYHQDWKPGSVREVGLRAWRPVAGGIMLLAFLGFSGERTDYMAHILGFAAGIAGGWMLGRIKVDWVNNISLQWICGALCLGLIGIAWLVAAAYSASA